MSKNACHRKKYMINPVDSYNKVMKHGSLPLLFRKSYDFKNTEQYKAAQQKNKEIKIIVNYARIIIYYILILIA